MVLEEFNGRPRYKCSVEGCVGAHGAHIDGRPLGIPADLKTRRARSTAHAAFDRIWEHGGLTRTQAYVWLSNAIGVQEAHMGNFDAEQCRKVVEAVKKDFPELFPFKDDVP